MSGDTLHARWLRESFHAQLREGMDTKVLWLYLNDLLDKKRDSRLTQLLFQHSHDSTTVYDAYAFGLLMTWYETGLISFVSISVGAGPCQDHKVDENNKILRGLPRGFSADFIPGKGTGDLDDGLFRWSVPIRIEHMVDGEYEIRTQPPGVVPFEVGTTRASRTLYHLRKDGGLARWPYDSKEIVLCVVTQKGREVLGCIGHVSDGDFVSDLGALFPGLTWFPDNTQPPDTQDPAYAWTAAAAGAPQVADAGAEIGGGK
jgi:hypothetical protein